MSGCGCEKPLDGVVEGVLVCLACGGALGPVAPETPAPPERSGRKRRLKRRAAAPVDTPWPAPQTAQQTAPVIPTIAAPEPPPFVDTLDAYTGAAEPEIETPVGAAPQAEPEIETPEPEVEVETSGGDPSLISSLGWYANAPAPIDDEPTAPAAAVETETAAFDEAAPTKPWFDLPLPAPEPTVDDDDAREDAPVETPVVEEDDEVVAQPSNDPPPEPPVYDAPSSPSRWTDSTPVTELPRSYEPGPAPEPWLEAPAASTLPNPYDTASDPWADTPAAAFSHPFDAIPSHEAWTEAPAHETWADVPAAAVAVDTLVEPPSIATFPEPPERFSGSPPMPPGMRAPGPTPGEPVTPASFMDPRVSFKRRHPVRRLLAFVLVVGLAAGAGYWWVNHAKPNPTAASAAAFLDGDGTVVHPTGTHFRVRFPTPGATVANPKDAMVGPGGAMVTVAQHVSIASTSGFGISVREIDYSSAVPRSQADSMLGGVARHLDGTLAPSVTYAHVVFDGHPAMRTFAHIKVGGLERRELYVLVGRRLFVVTVNAPNHDKQLFDAVVESFETTS